MVRFRNLSESPYLDEEGLRYLWTKTTAYVTEKIQEAGGEIPEGVLTFEDFAASVFEKDADGKISFRVAPDGGLDKGANGLSIATSFKDRVTSLETSQGTSTEKIHELETSVTTMSGKVTDLETSVTEKLSTVYRYKGSISNLTDLPAEGNTIGDVYNVENEGGMNYGWTGTVWDPLGGTFSIDRITNEQIDAITGVTEGSR